MESKISLIACIDQNNGIGHKNQLLFNIPGDLRFFREITTDSIVVMGRNTYESIGKPLKNRINIVLSRSYTYVEKFELAVVGVIVMEDLWKLKKILNTYDVGKDVYEQFIESADQLIITHVNKTKEADSFFPAISDDWIEEKSVVLTENTTVRYYQSV